MPESVTKAVSSLFSSEKYSDLTITCGERVFKVHRAIVCPQSEFLAKACDGSFREAFSGTIDLPDDNPDDISRLISFLYNADYDDKLHDFAPAAPNSAPVAPGNPGGYRLRSTTNNTDPEMVPMHTQQEQQQQVQIMDELAHQKICALFAQAKNVAMYGLAEKFVIPDLKTLAIDKFNIFQDPMMWMSGIPQLLRTAYTSVPASDKGMKSQLVNACAKYTPISGELAKAYRQVLVEIPEAHVDILQEQLSFKETKITFLSDDKTSLFKQKKRWLQDKKDWQEEKARLENQNRELQSQMRQLETENARLANEKRKAEDEARDNADRSENNEQWGQQKFDALRTKVNAARCINCRIGTYNAYSPHTRFHYPRVYLNEAENDFCRIGEAVARCRGCRNTL